MKPRLLFISNLFPDSSEPYRGLDNVTVLHHLRERWDIRVIALRPTLGSWIGRETRYEPREVDRCFTPVYRCVPYVPKLGSPFNHQLMRRALRDHVDEIPSDVVLAAWLYPDGWAVTQAFAGKPCVLIAQGSDVHGYMKDGVRRAAILEAVSDAKATITRSRSLATLLADAGANAARIHAIHNGVEPVIFHPGPKAEERSRLGVDQDVPLVLFVGNLLEVKNPHLLLRSFARLSPVSQLAIAGQGPLRSELEALCNELGIAGRVRFLGPQDATQIGAWMRAADVLCMSSLNEGLPNVVLEATASRLPVVATNVGGIHEVIDSPDKGILTPSGEVEPLAAALRKVLSDKPTVPLAADSSWAGATDAYHRVLMDAMDSSK